MRSNQGRHIQTCEITLLNISSGISQIEEEEDLHQSQVIQDYYIAQQPPANTSPLAHFLSRNTPDQRQILKRGEFAKTYLKLGHLEVFIVLHLRPSCSISLDPTRMKSFYGLNPSKVHIFLTNGLLIEKLNVATETDVAFLEARYQKPALV